MDIHIMRSFKFYLSFICMVFVLLPLHAKKVELEKAEKVAQRYVESKQKLRVTNNIRLKYTATNKRSHKMGNSLRAQSTISQNVADTVYYYVFNINESVGGGFLIVAGDDAVKPVLGYSERGNYDENNLPPNFAYWMDYLQQQIEYAQTQKLPQSKAISDEWEGYLNENISFSTNSVGTLIQTRWDQGSPYNDKCPLGMPTGCVATAMAQIMNYHNYPVRGNGQSSAYVTRTTGMNIPAVNFEVNYDWSNMLNIYSEAATPQQRDAVATMMYHCGVSVQMDYTSSNSGAYSSDVRKALINYFGYDYGMEFCERGYYSDDQWVGMIKTELSSSRPVYYAGSGPSGGHAFVCDGYDEENKFHFNWGWGGWYDGYFVLSALTPGTYKYNDTQSMVIGIKPSGTYSLSVDTRPMNFNVSGGDNTIDIISNINWIVNSNASWLTVSPESGVNSATIDVTASANTDVNQRTAIITIGGNGVMEKRINVTQYADGIIKGTIGSLTWSIVDDRILIISGTGAIPGYSWSAPAPWYSNRSLIKKISIQDGVTSIGSYAFTECNNLMSITIPNSVTSIGNYAASNCESLSSVTIPGSVTNIGYGTFQGCSSLSAIYVESGNNYYVSEGEVLFNKEKTVLVCYPGGKTGGYTIPNSVTSIGLAAFNSCSNLTSVAISDNVTSIGILAFYGCSGLTSLTIPGSVTSINDRSFAACSNLKHVMVNWETPSTITASAFENTNISFCTLHVPEGKETLYRAADVWKDFGTIIGPKAITSVSLNKSEIDLPINATERLTVTILPEDATNKNVSWNSNNTNVATVSNDGLVTAKTEGTATVTVTTQDGGKIAICTVNVMQEANNIIASGNFGQEENNLHWVLTNDYVLTISGMGTMQNFTYPGYAPWYSYCSQITQVKIENGVTNIGSHAFHDCARLVSVSVPKSIVSIERFAFNNCYTLSSIDVDSENVTFSSDNGVLFDKNKFSLLLCPRGKTEYIIPENVKNIGESAFSMCGKIESVIMPSSLISISSYAFWNCTVLTSVIIPENVTSIEEYAFYDTGISSITIPESVTNIGSGAFQICKNLQTVNFSAIECISEAHNVFSDCSKLTTINIGSKVKTIPAYIFQNCYEVTSINIPSNVISIGRNAFNNCTGLKSVSFSKGIINIGIYAFSYCEGLISVTIPESLTNLGQGAFSNCENLQTVNFNAVNSISEFLGARDIFSSCNNLTTINIGSQVEGIPNNAFRGCIALTDVTANWINPISINSSIFTNITLSNVNLHVPDGTQCAYVGAPVWQDFNIVKPSQEIIFPTIPTKTYGDAPITLPEKTSAGLTISYQSSNTAVATVLGNILTIIGTGTTDITARQSGSCAYTAATSIIQTLTVIAPITYDVNIGSFSGGSVLVRIINTGNRATGSLTLALSGADADAFTLSATTINTLAVGEEIVITLTPIDNFVQGTYIATLTISGEGLESKSIEITYNSTVDIGEVAANRLQIFPNPVKDDLFIKSDLQIGKVEIYSLTGDLLLQENNFSEKISVSALLSGVYLIKIYTDKGMTISKIIKD